MIHNESNNEATSFCQVVYVFILSIEVSATDSGPVVESHEMSPNNKTFQYYSLDYSADCNHEKLPGLVFFEEETAKRKNCYSTKSSDTN